MAVGRKKCTQTTAISSLQNLDLHERKRQNRKIANKKYYDKLKSEIKVPKSYSVLKDAIRKRIQRQKLKEKQKSEEIKRQKNNQYQKRFQLKKKQGYDQTYECCFRNRMQKSRAVKKFKRSLPETPRRRASLISSYLNQKSPTIEKLHRAGVILTKKERSDNIVQTSVLDDLKSALQSTKKKISSENLQSRSIIFAAVTGENVSKSKCKRNLAKYLGVHCRQIAGGIRTRAKVLKDENSSWRLTEKKNRNNKISEDMKRSVYEFWLGAGISRPTGNKKDIKRERLAPHIFVSHTVHVLEVTQTEAYQQFRRAHPDIQISQRSFERFKPFFVRPVKEADRNTCMCRYHVEIKTVLNSCMKLRKGILEQRDNGSDHQFPVFQNINEAVQSTLCEKDDYDEFYNTDCLNRNCNKCGVRKLSLMQEEQSKETSVEWERFEYVSLPSKGCIRKKLMLVKKKTSVYEMFSYFVQLLSTFPAHQFRAVWQNEQLKAIRSALPLNDVICIHDFSENYRLAAKDELQSNYFQRTEATIHVTILHRHATLEVDGRESTDSSPDIVTEQFIVISNDDKHDHHFVHRVQELIRDYLLSINYKVNTLHEFTDGCQSQYKSRHCMGDVSYGCYDLGCQRVIRNYFETSHAKRPQDAAGGFVKRAFDQAILRGAVKLQTAEDCYAYARDHLTGTRKDSTASRGIFRYESSVDRKRNRYFDPIKSNRNIHQIMNTEKGVLTIRNISCYICQRCQEGRYEDCQQFRETNTRIVKTEISKSATEEPDEGSEPTLKDLVQMNAVVAVYTDDPGEDYYLIKTTGEPETLKQNATDVWGGNFIKNALVIRGLYYRRVNSSLRFKLISNKPVIVSLNSVLCPIDIPPSKSVVVPNNVHEDLIGMAEECGQY